MKPTARSIPYLLLALAILGGAPASGCLFDDEAVTCNEIAADQKGSLKPPVDIDSPVVVEIDSRFTATQVLSVQEAIAIWNAFGQASLHRTLFEGKIGAVDQGERPSSISDCGFGGSSNDGFHVIRLDSEVEWKSLGLSDRNPGVTVRCTSGSGMHGLAKQAVLINTRYAAPTQLTSILLHELGHALGLDHSCQMDNGTPDFTSCFGLSEEHAYHQAIMYPSLRTGQSTEAMEIKDVLKANDRERAVCIFKNR